MLGRYGFDARNVLAKKGWAPAGSNVRTDLEVIARKQNYPSDLCCNLRLAYEFKASSLGRPSLSFSTIRWVSSRLGCSRGVWVEGLC